MIRFSTPTRSFRFRFRMSFCSRVTNHEFEIRFEGERKRKRSFTMLVATSLASYWWPESRACSFHDRFLSIASLVYRLTRPLKPIIRANRQAKLLIIWACNRHSLPWLWAKTYYAITKTGPSYLPVWQANQKSVHHYCWLLLLWPCLSLKNTCDKILSAFNLSHLSSNGMNRHLFHILLSIL